MFFLICQESGCVTSILIHLFFQIFYQKLATPRTVIYHKITSNSLSFIHFKHLFIAKKILIPLGAKLINYLVNTGLSQKNTIIQIGKSNLSRKKSEQVPTYSYCT